MTSRCLGLLALAFAIALVPACSLSPRHEFDPAADFSTFSSYSWRTPDYDNVQVSDPILDSELLGKRVAAAVNEHLQARGFVRDDENPDMLLTYRTAKDYEVRDEGPQFSFGFFRGFGNVATGMTVGSGHSVRKEGVLIIDIIDTRSDSLVWRGWRDLPLHQENFNSIEVQRSVDNILAAFPPERQTPDAQGD